MTAPGKSNAGRAVVRKTVPGTAEDVFDAWTNAKKLATWMSIGSEKPFRAEIDLKVGGKFKIEMFHEGAHHPHTGEYRIIDRPNTLSFTWISDWTDNQPSVVTIHFSQKGDNTELLLTHEGLPEQWAMPHESGWGEFIDSLSGWLNE